MLRQFIIWLMKVLLDLQIVLSLIAVIVVIGVTVDRNLGSWVLAAEIVGAAFALVAIFGLLSLLVEINENLIRLRQAPTLARRIEPTP